MDVVLAPSAPRIGSPSRRTVVALALLALLCGLGLLAPGSPAAAHADFVSSDPGDGARLDVAPTEVVLTFTEPVSITPDGLTVVDSTGARVDEGEPTAEGTTVRVALADDVGDGGYVITWRLISGDSHPIRGATTFTVGDGPAVSASAVTDIDAGSRGWEVAGAIARIAMFLALGLAVGGTLFLAFAHDGEEPEATTIRRLLLLAAGVASVAALVQLPIQGALATGGGIGALWDDGVAEQVLGDGFGWSIGLLAAGAALLGVALVVAGSHRPAQRAVTVPVALLTPLALGLTGHTRAGDGAGLASVADGVHGLAGMVWFGGLALLALTWRWRRHQIGGTDPVTLAGIVARFSVIASGAVVLVLVLGVALAWREVGSIDALTSTRYGGLVLVKVGLGLAVAALGLQNNRYLVPRVVAARTSDGEVGAWRSLGRNVRFEALALVLVLGVSGVLVNVTPAKHAVPASPTTPYEATLEIDGGRVDLVVDPTRVGVAQVHLYLVDADGQPLEAEAVEVSYELPSAGVAPIRRTADVAGPGHFVADGSAMNIAGEWTITLDARLSRFEESSASTQVSIRS